MRLQEFRPTQLFDVLESIRRQHPHTSGHFAAPDQSLMGDVRHRLLEADRSRLTELARTFQLSELRAVLYLLAIDTNHEVRDRAAEVVLARERTDFLRIAWTLLCNHYPNDPLEMVVGRMGSRIGWERATSNRELSARLPEWFAAPRLPSGLLRDFASQSTDELDNWLAEWGLDERQGLNMGVWADALSSADKGLIARIGHEVLLRRAQRSRQGLQEEFCRNYLVALEGRQLWKQRVLEWIQSKYDKPFRLEEGLTTFWYSIPAQVRDEYRRWANEETIRDFFESARDHYGRFEFWQGFIEHVEDARMALGQEAMLMDFGSFGVAEFAEVGNAAYVYPHEFFPRIWNRDSSAMAPGDLKERKATLRGRRGGPNLDGRILHSGEWQLRYGPWIQRLIESR